MTGKEKKYSLSLLQDIKMNNTKEKIDQYLLQLENLSLTKETETLFRSNLYNIYKSIVLL